MNGLCRAALEDILERNHQMLDGDCPWCGAEDSPVDKNGKEIPFGNCEDAIEWRCAHSETCAVTMIEDLLTGKYEFLNPT